MSRIDDIEKRLAALEKQVGTAGHLEKAVEEAAAAARLSEAAGDVAHRVETLVLNMHKELDDVLRRHLGIGFEAKGFARRERARWRP